MKKNISSLQELEKEQQRLELLMQESQQLFSKSIRTNQKQVKNFLLKEVTAPTELLGIGLKLLMNKNQQRPTINQNNSTQDFASMLLPLGINFLQLYLNRQKSNLIH